MRKNTAKIDQKSFSKGSKMEPKVIKNAKTIQTSQANRKSTNLKTEKQTNLKDIINIEHIK